MRTFQYEKLFSAKNLNAEFDIVDKKIKNLEIPNGFLQFILYSISELFSNIEEHSRSKKVFFQVKITKKECLIEIKDNGIGLRKSYLLRKIVPKDDSSAIEFALAGLSTKDLGERGYGFYNIKKFIEELNGKMEIATGEVQAIIEKNKIQFKKIQNYKE